MSSYHFLQNQHSDPLLQSYVHEVWDYGSTDTKNIQEAVQNFDWEKAFENRFVDRKVKTKHY